MFRPTSLFLTWGVLLVGGLTLAGMARRNQAAMAYSGLALLALSGVAWVAACCALARARGRDWWWGLLGLAGPLGLLVLVLLPKPTAA